MEQIGSEYNFNTGGSIKALNDLIVRFEQLEKQVKKTSKSTDDAGNSVDNTGKKAKKTKAEFDALGNSINQVTREFPAFAFSAQTGFLAVSNNIPILLDSINQLKKANADLAAQGKATIPVFKQIISSLFSWQTALSLLVSFSVLYGKEIGNFIINTFKASGSIDILKERVNALNQAYKSKELSGNIENLITLKKNLELAKDGYVNKQDVLKIYNEEFGRVLGTTNDVNIAEQNLINATPALINAYVQRAASAKITADASETLIQIQEKEAKFREESINRTQLGLNELNRDLNRNFITQEQYNTKVAKLFDENSLKTAEKRRLFGAGEIADLKKKYDNQIKLSLDFNKKSEEILKGAGLIDDGSKQREAERLKKLKEAADKAKALLEKRVQDELNIVQEAYIKEISLKDATNKTKEEAELRLLNAQIAIFEKYKKYDEKYAQDSLDTREKLAEKKLSISEEEKANELKRLQEEFKIDDAFMKKTIDNELDAIKEKYVNLKKGKVLSVDEQLQLDLEQTQETIAYLDLVKEAGEKQSDDLVKLKEKESDILTKINDRKNKKIKKSDEELANEERKIFQGISDILSTTSNGYFNLRKNQLQEETNVQLEELDKQKQAKTISEEQYNTKKKELLNQQAQKQREYDLSEIKIQTAIAIIKAFATGLTPFDRILGASLAAAQGAIQYAFAESQPLPQFAKGTDRVLGGIKGKDSVHALLMPDEAVIPTKENLARPGLAKAWIDGNLDRHLMMNYIKPAIEDNNRRWEASLKVNQNSTFIRNDNFNDKRIVDNLVRINRKLNGNNVLIGRNNRRGLWN